MEQAKAERQEAATGRAQPLSAIGPARVWALRESERLSVLQHPGAEKLAHRRGVCCFISRRTCSSSGAWSFPSSSSKIARRAVKFFLDLKTQLVGSGMGI